MKKLILLLTSTAIFLSCKKNDNIADVEKPDLKNRSNAPAFVEMFPEFSSIIYMFIHKYGLTRQKISKRIKKWKFFNIE
jgi:hypothetical protein